MEVAIQNLACILIGRILALALAYIGHGLHGLALGWLIGAVCCLILLIYLMQRKLDRFIAHRTPA